MRQVERLAKQYAIDSVGGAATAADIAFKQIMVKGFWQKKINQSMAVEKRKSMMKKLIYLAETGKLKLPVDAIYPMNDVKNAVTASLQSSRKGKVLLRP